MGGLRVPRHVRERFLHDAVERGLGRRREPRPGRPRDRDPEPGALRDAVRQELERRLEPEVVEDGGPQLVREVPELLLDLVEE